MASNELSDRTVRRLRLTLAKRIAGAKESSKPASKHKCRGLPRRPSTDSDIREVRCDDELDSMSSDLDLLDDGTSDNGTASGNSELASDELNSDYDEINEAEETGTDSESCWSEQYIGSDYGSDREDLSVLDHETDWGWSSSTSDIEQPRHLDDVTEPQVETPRVPLFDGSDVTEDEAVVALLSLASRHRLTYASIEDILHFVSSLLPMPNGLTISLHRLIGRFVNFSKETTVHKFCGNCSAVLHNGAKCTKSACVSVSQPDATFIEIPLQNQIQEKMQDENFYKLVQYRFTRECTEGEIQDVYDGRLYKDNCNFFSCESNLSLSLNYDGAPKFRSSGMQVWPIQFIINELPPQLRTTKEHILISGVWCSCQKPCTNAFLQPVMERLRELEEQGITVKIGPEDIHCRVKLLMVVADLPAKASVLNCNQ